jgi:hypothetical protein
MQRVINIVQRWPADFPLGALAALKEIGLKLPTEPSAASAAPGVGSAQPATHQLGAGRERPATQRATVTTLANVEFALMKKTDRTGPVVIVKSEKLSQASAPVRVQK